MRKFLVLHKDGGVRLCKTISQETLDAFRMRDVLSVVNLKNETHLVLQEGSFTWLLVN